MKLLCRIGLHTWRTVERKSLPPLPKFPNPRFIRCKCVKCGKTDWSFLR